MVSHKKALKLFSGEINHVWGTEAMAVAFPDEGPSEVAVIGRSNVGKSSLINAVTTRKKLARTSNTPGATKGVHFFDIDGHFHLVDLPGYGFAKMSKKLAAKIAEMIDFYLLNRRTLRKVFVLVDARHGLKELDRKMLDQLSEAGIPAQVILTKLDKTKQKDRDKMFPKIEADIAAMPFVDDEILQTSTVKGWGVDEVRMAMLEAAGIK